MEPQTVIPRRIAQELAPGILVNLGIGIPTLVANYVPEGVHAFFQSENGLIGTGAPPEEGMAHPTLTDAGGRPVTALPGASTFDSAMSFGLIGAGHGGSHGSGNRCQARHCGDATYRQGRPQDHEEMLAAHHVVASCGFGR